MSLDEGLLRKRVEDGLKAVAVLENPVFRDCGERYQKTLLQAFKGEDDDIAWEAKRKVLVFEEFLAMLSNIAKKGVQAQVDLNRLSELEHRAKSTV